MTIAAPLLENRSDFVWCWIDGCRTWFGPRTSDENAHTLSTYYMGWILIFEPPSDDQYSPHSCKVKLWQMQPPFLENWSTIRCSWFGAYRTCSGPQTSFLSAWMLLGDYMGWMNRFWPASQHKNMWNFHIFTGTSNQNFLVLFQLSKIVRDTFILCKGHFLILLVRWFFWKIKHFLRESVVYIKRFKGVGVVGVGVGRVYM